MTVFVHDDDGYVQWVTAHPDDYVVNTYRSPSSRYVILHRATCSTIIDLPANGRRWTADYQKVCGLLAEVTSWALKEVGVEPRPSGVCLRDNTPGQ